MGSLTRDAILAAEDLQTETVDVPEWGGTVRIRALTGTQRDAFEASIVKIRKDDSRELNLANMRARFCALTMVDDQGELLFAETDVKALGQKSAMALERVWTAARRLSGLSDDDVEKLTEDFDGDPSDASTSD